jgi:hypothetical protein
MGEIGPIMADRLQRDLAFNLKMGSFQAYFWGLVRLLYF